MRTISTDCRPAADWLAGHQAPYLSFDMDPFLCSRSAVIRRFRCKSSSHALNDHTWNVVLLVTVLRAICIGRVHV